MFTGGKASDVHLSKKIQENLDNSRAAYLQAKQDFAAAEKDALETLDASGWNSGVQASAFPIPHREPRASRTDSENAPTASSEPGYLIPVTSDS